MSEPKDHSQSGSDPGFEAAGAQRFWGDYARRARAGGRRGAGNGRSGAPDSAGYAAGPEADPLDPGMPPGMEAQHQHDCLEWCPICRTADLLRASAPPELRDQLQGIQRDALVTMRQLLDAYLERIGERPSRRGGGIEDIPID
jgi:hypothetical protein